jgi:hypothetical protein
LFVLGIGAQKAGTTWLSAQLLRHPDYRTIFAKEVHFWDDRYGLREDRAFDKEKLGEFLTNSQSSDFDAPSGMHPYFYFLRISMWNWRRLFGLSTITADITPAYSGLPRFVFAQIGKGLRDRKIDYRVVFLMRDPVSRVLSAWKMADSKAKRLGRDLRGFSLGLETDTSIRRFADSWGCQIRTRYDITLASLDAVFERDRTYIGFQESLGVESELNRLSKFFGLSREGFSGTQLVNVGKKVPPVKFETLQYVAQTYRTTYAEVGKKYPETLSLWNGFNYLN